MKNWLLIVIGLLPLFVNAQTEKATTRPLYDKRTVGEIRLTLPNKNWSDALDSLRLYGNGMLAGSVSIDGNRYEGVGVRFRGDKSYQLGMKRNPFTIKLNYTDTDAEHQGFKVLKLSSALRDPSMVREMLFLEIANKYIPSPEASYTKLYVNDEYIGVFINVENIDEGFASRHYAGNGQGLFYKAGVDYKPADLPATCRQNIFGSLEYEENPDCYKGNFETQGSMPDFKTIQEFTRILNQDPRAIPNTLDVDRALWMLALNNVMVNLSSYSGNYSVNYYLYRDSFNRFQVIPWDLNLAFGSYKNTGAGSDLSLRELQELSPLLHADNPYKPLISQLLKDPFNRKIYLSHIRQIVEDNFASGSYETRAKELQAQIVVPFNDDKFKVYSLDDFKASLNNTVGKRSRIPGIVELMSKRVRFLKSQPELTALPPVISEPAVEARGTFEKDRLTKFHIKIKADRFPKRALIYYRFSDMIPYSMVVMQEEPSSDLPSGMKRFSISIDAPGNDAVLDYYILAENAGTVSFTPAQYTQKPFKLRLSDLNK